MPKVSQGISGVLLGETKNEYGETRKTIQTSVPNDPYGSKHCLRRYLSLQIIVNYIPNTSQEGTWIHRGYLVSVIIFPRGKAAFRSYRHLCLY